MKEGYVTVTIDEFEVVEGNVNIQDFMLEVVEAIEE